MYFFFFAVAVLRAVTLFLDCTGLVNAHLFLTTAGCPAWVLLLIILEVSGGFVVDKINCAMQTAFAFLPR
jgi:hypothetical protein